MGDFDEKDQLFTAFLLGPKKYQKNARMYDRTGLSTKCTLIKTGFINLRTGTEAKFRPFVEALVIMRCNYKYEGICNVSEHISQF